MRSLKHLLTNCQHDEVSLQRELDTLLAKRLRVAGQKELRPLNNRIRTIRLKLAKIRGNHSEKEWQALVDEFDRHCVICGEKIPEGARLCKAYIIPIAMGGSASIDNIQPTCASCASMKGADATDFVAIRRQDKASAAGNG